jgi:hypothetical protein
MVAKAVFKVYDRGFLLRKNHLPPEQAINAPSRTYHEDFAAVVSSAFSRKNCEISLAQSID